MADIKPLLDLASTLNALLADMGSTSEGGSQGS